MWTATAALNSDEALYNKSSQVKSLFVYPIRIRFVLFHVVDGRGACGARARAAAASVYRHGVPVWERCCSFD